MGFKFSGVGISASFFWYSIWFVAIVLSALAADLFQNNGNWMYNSLKNIEEMNISSEEKMKLIKYHLGIGVDRYMSVFLQVNGFESAFKKLLVNTSKIYKGVISIKEIIVIILYALYDLVLRGGMLSLTEPWDIMILFTGLIALKIIDATGGFPSLVAEMYKEANLDRDSDSSLVIISDYIVQLGYLFSKEQEKHESPETRAKEIIEELTEIIPKIQPQD